jgi:hypothetical protein
MVSDKLQLKLYVEQNGKPFELEPFVPVFHDWIRTNALGELLLDVVDYAHVQNGPGVVLIGHAADYSLDLRDGRPGLLYNKKRQPPPAGERFTDAFRRALKACTLLEQEQKLDGHVRFKTDQLVVKVVDRAATANDDDSFAALRSELEPTLAKVYGGAAVRVERVGTPKELLTARITASDAPSAATLLSRL